MALLTVILAPLLGATQAGATTHHLWSTHKWSSGHPLFLSCPAHYHYQNLAIFHDPNGDVAVTAVPQNQNATSNYQEHEIEFFFMDGSTPHPFSATLYCSHD
jgi:hypothetical protein